MQPLSEKLSASNANMLEHLIQRQAVALQEALSIHEDIRSWAKNGAAVGSEAPPVKTAKVVGFETEDPDVEYFTASTPLLTEDTSRPSAYQSMVGTYSETVASSRWKGGGSPTRRLSRHLTFFPNKEQIRSTLEETLSKNQAHRQASDFYHDTGFWQALARNRSFNNCILTAIILNTFWIAIDADCKEIDGSCPSEYLAVDNMFCFIFTFEMLARFSAFRSKRQALLDRNFVFDAFLVFLMVWESWISPLLAYLGFSLSGKALKSASILRLFRAFRLLRVARSGRLLNAIPELMVLARGMVLALRSVLSVMFLLVLVIFLFAIIFTQLLRGSDTGDGKFESVPQAMNFLLLQVLCGFDANLINQLLAASWIAYVLYLVFVVIASMTIMNMLIGILCDVVSTTTKTESDEAFMRDLDSQVRDIARRLDTKGTESIDRAEFDAIVMDPDLAQNLEDLGVDVVSICDYANFVYDHVEKLSYNDFLNMVSQFRGANSTTVKDIMDLRKYVGMELSYVKNILDAHLSQLDNEIAENSRSAPVFSPLAEDSPTTMTASGSDGQMPNLPRRRVSTQSGESRSFLEGRATPMFSPLFRNPSKLRRVATLEG